MIILIITNYQENNVYIQYVGVKWMQSRLHDCPFTVYGSFCHGPGHMQMSRIYISFHSECWLITTCPLLMKARKVFLCSNSNGKGMSTDSLLQLTLWSAVFSCAVSVCSARDRGEGRRTLVWWGEGGNEWVILRKWTNRSSFIFGIRSYERINRERNITTCVEPLFAPLVDVAWSDK